MTEAAILARLRHCDPVGRRGRVTRVLPGLIEGSGPNLEPGSLCRVGVRGSMIAEIVSVDHRAVRLAPYRPTLDIRIGDPIEALPQRNVVAVGDAFLGRVIDALGQPIDGNEAVDADAWARLEMVADRPMTRHTHAGQLETGIRAIDGLLPLGIGQRVGIFAASGVGKTSLVNQLACQVAADRCVICSIGERGREIEHLWADVLPASLRQRAVLVAATSDESAILRVRAAEYAMALARHWRAEGHHVLVLFDSISRYAMALREIGLSAGEPPTVRGFTPNAFAALPRLVEQCGALRGAGAISAFFTVLSETDDNDDPIVEVMKSLLDGHIVLSRELAEKGHFPAIDIARSISRLARGVSDKAVLQRMADARDHLAVHAEAKLLIESGLYKQGTSRKIDQAIEVRARLDHFLRQDMRQSVTVHETQRHLGQVLEGIA